MISGGIKLRHKIIIAVLSLILVFSMLMAVNKINAGEEVNPDIKIAMYVDGSFEKGYSDGESASAEFAQRLFFQPMCEDESICLEDYNYSWSCTYNDNAYAGAELDTENNSYNLSTTYECENEDDEIVTVYRLSGTYTISMQVTKGSFNKTVTIYVTINEGDIVTLGVDTLNDNNKIECYDGNTTIIGNGE